MTQARITLAAQDNTGPAFKSAQGNLARVQGAAVSAQSALALLGIGVSLAGFVAATKAAIDGLDALKDASDITGASVENLSALEDVARRNGQSLDTVTTSLVKFNQVLGGIKPGNDADQALKALGLRAAELRALDPAEALRQTAVALSAYADDANKARLVQELFGKSIREVGPYLKDLAEQGSLVAKVTTAQAEEAEKFNKQLFALQTSANDLARALAGPLVTGVNEAIRLFKEADKEGRSYLETLIGLTEINRIFGLGFGKSNADVYQEQITRLKEIDGLLESGNLHESRRNSLLRERQTLGEKTRARSAGVPFEDGFASSTVLKPSLPATLGGKDPAQSEFASIQAALEKRAETLSQELQLGRELSESEKFKLDLLQKINGEKSKLSPAQQAELTATLEAVTAYGELEESLKRTTKLNQALYAQQIEFEAELSAAYVDESKSREQARLAVDDYVRGIDESNALVALELGLLGQTQQARDIAIQQYQIELALKKELSKIDANLALDEAQREELRAKATAAAARASAAVVGRVTLDEWRKTTEQIESSLTDALLRGFESGKGFGRNLVDTLKNLFQTLVLRPVISAVINPVAGGITSLLGAGGPGGAGGLTSALGGLTGLGGSLSSGLSAGFSALLGESGISGAISAGLTSIGTATGSGIAAGLGTLAGAFGPIAIGVGALYNYFKSKEGGPKTESGFGPLVPNVGDPTAARAISQSITAGYTELARELGIRVGDLQVGVLTAIDSRGKALTQLAVEAVLDGQTISSRGARLGTNENVGRTPEALTAAVAEEYNVVLLEALKRSNLRDDLRAYLDSYVASGLNPETAIDNLQLLAGTDRAFAALGLRFSYLTGLSLETQQAIVGLAGGLDAFVTNLATYEQNFYTEAERSASTLAAVGLQLSALNLMLPTTREGFRALVEAQDLTTEAGQRAYTTLLAASGAFASAVPAIEATANAAAELASTLRQSLSDALDAARSNTDAAYAALERATDAQRRLAQEQIDAISGVISAIGDNVRSLYNEVDSTRAQSTRQGAAFIAQALETARLTGYLPDGEKLSEAITAARSDQVFATQQEADFARLVLAGQLSQLGDLAGDQLSESERMLKSLDDGLALARAQIDAVRGVDNSVINVVDAIAALNTSLAAEIQALKAVTEIGNATLASQFGSFISSIYQLELGRAPDPTGLAYFGDRLSAGASLSDVAAGIANSPEALARDAIARAMQAVSSTAQTPTPPPPPAFSNPFDSAVAEIYRSQLGRAPDAAGLEYFSSRLSGGAALADVLAAISGSQEAQMRNLLAGLPQYEQGTPFVPNDGLAFLHRGEAVIPSQYNTGGQGSGDMVAEIRAMRAELAELRKSAAATAANTDRTAEAVNGRPDRPMLVEMAA